MMYIDLNSVAILNIDSIDYRYVINGITQWEAINLLGNADLSESGSLYKFSLLYKKMYKEIISFGDIEIKECKFQCYRNPIFLRECRY